MSRLKELRIEKGLTQLNVQLATGIEQSDYSKLELGKRPGTMDQCRRLALLFETSMDYIAGLTDIKEPYERNEKYKSVDKYDIRNR